MIDIFAPPTTDLSMQYLYQLFGSFYVPNGTCIVSCTGCPCQSSTNILGQMFLMLNLGILTIAVLGAIYFTIVGLVSTAQEGEFMGKKYHNIWIPIRMVMGIALMVPTASGYSVLQYVMMWVVVAGVGVADTVWTTGLAYVSINGSVSGQMSLPTPPPSISGGLGAQNAMGNVLVGLICDASAYSKFQDPTGLPAANGYCYNNNSSWCSQPNTFSAVTDMSNATPPAGANTYQRSTPSSAQLAANPSVTYAATPFWQLGPKGSCGAMAYCDASTDNNDANAACSANNGGPNGKPCQLCTAQITALTNYIIPALQGVAAQFVAFDQQYRNFFNASWILPPSEIATTFPLMAAYCSAKSIGTGACCIPPSNPAFLLFSQCKVTPNPGNYPNFPGPNNPSFNQDVNSQAIQKIFFPTYLNSVDPVGVALGQYNCLLSNGATSTTCAASQVPPVPPPPPESPTGFNVAACDCTAQPNCLACQKIGTGGWIQAGEFYFTLANANGVGTGTLSNTSGNQTTPTGQQVTQATVTSGPPPLNFFAPVNQITSNANLLEGTRNNVMAAQALLSASTSSGSAGSNLSGAPSGSETTSAISNAAQSIPPISSVNTGNPMTDYMSTGQSYLMAATALYPILLTIGIATTTAAFIMPMALGTGLTQNPAEGAMEAVNAWMVPPLYALMSIFIFYGGLMTIYLPLIPFIIFVTAVIGWFISVLEALVAGPIVALGIMSPSGQHEFLGKAESGLMMLFSVFLKPTLMIIGFFAGIMLDSAIVGMINSFWGTITGNFGVGGTVGTILLNGAQLMLVLGVVSKCFSTVYVLPNQVLTWISGPAGREAGGEMTEAAKHGVERAGGSYVEGAKSLGSAEQFGVGARQAEKGGAYLKGRSKAAAAKAMSSLVGGLEETGIKPGKYAGKEHHISSDDAKSKSKTDGKSGAKK